MSHFNDWNCNRAAQMVFDEWYKVNGEKLYSEWLELTDHSNTDGPTFDEYIDSCYDLYCFPPQHPLQLPG